VVWRTLPPRKRQRSSPTDAVFGVFVASLSASTASASTASTVSVSTALASTGPRHPRPRSKTKNKKERKKIMGTWGDAPRPRASANSRPPRTHAAVGASPASPCSRRRLPSDSADGRPARTRPSAPPDRERRRSSHTYAASLRSRFKCVRRGFNLTI